MPKNIIKVGCACGIPVCYKSIHASKILGRDKVRVTIVDSDVLHGNITLDRERCKVLGKWLLEAIE